MNRALKKIIRPFYYWSKLLFKINWFKTLYLNFRTQRLVDAIKLPIIVYGKLKIYSLRGNIVIDAPIQTGMIHIGKDVDHNPVSLCPIKFTINGDLVFKGRALISGGSTVTVWSGKIILGKNISLGSGVQIKSVEGITIGDYTRIVALTTVMDTNVHYVKNIETGDIKKNSAPITIGNNCWINSGSIVTKGAVIPDYCIAARNTFLNKDYSQFCKPNSMFAGSPAKVIAIDIQRIFNFQKETELNDYFRLNADKNIFLDEMGIYEEPHELGSLFKLF